MQRATLILTLSRTTFKFCQNDLRDGFTAELPQSQDMMVLSIPPMPFYYGYQKCEVRRAASFGHILSPFALSYHSPKAKGLNFPRYVHAHTGEYLM